MNTRTHNDIEAERIWHLARIRQLKGRKIADVFVHEENGMLFPVLKLDDDTLIVVNSDAEGNGGGFLKIVSREQNVPLAAHQD